ncbi:MAG: TetR family transcriptional regulator [Rhodococcus sp. (in: high G+C Gram-positive bacteria)]|nr:MAG: TetR family transcriptional regulator [Rhodococcus sp. (in: high G+C Gram-positive bacteria)]
MSSPKVAVRRRPKDRKAQILEAARTLIVGRGYRNVSMAQIAEEVGITAGALYRHFSNKAVLLGAVIGASFDDVTPAIVADESLADVVAESCTYIAGRRDVGALWWRESRHLPDDMREELRDRLRAINRRHADLIRFQRPDLEESSAEVLAWGVQSILASPGFHSSKLPLPEFAALLTQACLAVCAAEVSPPRAVPERRPSRLTPVSKREALLGHAVELFGENGYEATGLDDIGASAGVTGPNLYSYFESKADLLQAAIERGTSALWLLLHSVLRENDDPRRALVALVGGYVRLTVDKTILTSLLLTEQSSLTDVARARQREYVAEWTALLRASRPRLDETSARILVHTALGLIHIMPRIEHLQANESFSVDLTAMATAVLLTD